jgi:lambda repressor-like predicted transcriptional regulator
MDVISLLPLLKGWAYSTKDIDVPFTVPAGEEKIIEEAKKSGWFVAAMCSLNDPYAEFVVYSYDPYKGVVRSDMVPYEIKAAGLITPTPTGIWCSRYDDTNKIYVVNFNPFTWLPFIENYRLSIKASTSGPLTVYNYAHVLVVIEDRELFINSLQEVLGAKIKTFPRYSEILERMR